MTALKLIIEGIILGGLLVVYCLVGIRGGAVGMVFLYHKDVQDRCVELGLTTHEKIRRRAIIFKIFGIVLYLAYAAVCVYAINGAEGFLGGFLQLFVILSICNVIDRLLVDEFWVCHTKAWIIPGTEDLMPYINRKDKCIKWLSGTVGMAVISAAVAGIAELVR